MTQHGIDNDFHKLQRFYSWQSRIYDTTRWSFLFGRKVLLEQVGGYVTPTNILDVGCGTGSNLLQLARQFPQAKLTGVDLSPDMLGVAKRKLASFGSRVNFLQQAYGEPLAESFDLIIFSYSLSMMNPGFEQVLQVAHRNLAEDGVIAVVDFADTPSALFRRWMALNHVRMDGHLLPVLSTLFGNRYRELRVAYAGLWRYFVYIGIRQPAN